ncbi:3847_t:CDS:2 [Entrophospora sp. SA101]|nr:3847_t:CDS:2 [Entrophospora sp. SA101]
MESTTTSYNMRSPAVKRLLKEARELQQDTCSDYTAQPLENNLFEWHFVIRGPDSTEFEGGRFQCFQTDYPQNLDWSDNGVALIPNPAHL